MICSTEAIRCSNADIIQSAPLATEPGISLIVLPLIRILHRNLTHTLQTRTTDTHYRHTLQTPTTDAHYRHNTDTRTTDTHTTDTHSTDTHYRHSLQTRTTDTHFRHTHYRHTLQTHSSSFLTQRTYSFSNFVAISSLLLKLLKKIRVR